MITRTRETQENGSFVETLTEEQSSAAVKQTAAGKLTFELKIYKDTAEEYKKTAFEFLKAIAEVETEAIRLGLA